MDSAALLNELLDLAREAGLEVRGARASAGEAAPESAVCRVKDRVWVVLSTADPVEIQIDVVVDALRTHAAHLIEARYLAPAVRERLAEP